MKLSREELLSQLRDMDEYEFEELVADVWEQRGWETTVTTGVENIYEKGETDPAVEITAQPQAFSEVQGIYLTGQVKNGDPIISPPW